MIKNKREKEVLEAIIKYYLTSGEAVGSRTLVKKYHLDASPATIRNVMADLEDMGYIEKVHSSSGRAPTSKGYKYYIDYLLEVQKLTEKEISSIKRSYEAKTKELEFVLSKSISLLSEMTQYVGIALEPEIAQENFKKIEFVSLDNFNILAVVVTENLSIKTKKIYINNPLKEDELKDISNSITNSLEGRKISDILLHLNEIKLEKDRLALIKDCFSDMETSLYIQSSQSVRDEILQESNIDVNVNVNSAKGELKHFLESLIKNNKIEKGKINILLGEDLQLEQMKDLSLICSTYEFGNSNGIIGIVGPKRMEYSKIVSLVEYVAKEVTNLSSKYKKE